MTTQQLKRIWIVLSALTALLVGDLMTREDTREYLAGIRSEVATPVMVGSVIQRAATSVPVAGQIPAAGSDVANGSGADHLSDPPTSDERNENDNDRKARSVWRKVYDGLRRAGANTLRRLGLLEETPNLSTAAATASPHQAAQTYEAWGAAVVPNDPVLPHSGEMTFSKTLVRIPGTGFDFSFQMTYRSGFEYHGPLGRNWEHNWNVRIEETSTTSDITRYAGNRVEIYPTVQGDTTSFTSPTGFFEHSIVRDTSGGTHTVTRTLQDGTVETYTKFSGAANWYMLTEVKHRAGKAITLDYDATNNDILTKITDTRGKYWKLVYDTSGYLSLLEDWGTRDEAADREWTFHYSSGDLTSYKTPAIASVRRETKFAYATSGNLRLLTSVTDPREASAGTAYLKLWYDGNDRATKQQFGPTGQDFTFAYTTQSGDVTQFQETDREGVLRYYDIDPTNGNLTKIRVDPLGDDWVTTYGWDTSEALLTKITLPEGNGFKYAYDAGRLTKSARFTSAGASGAITRNANHLVTEYNYAEQSSWTLVDEIIDPNNNTWSMTRDSEGNVTAYKTPEHTADPWDMSYDADGRLTSIDDPEGRTTDLEYDSDGLLDEVIRDPGQGLALSTKYDRDKDGAVTKVTDPEGNITEFTRNILGFVTKVKSPELHETEYKYDLNDVVTEVLQDHDNDDITTNTQHKWTVEYNLLDLVTKVKQHYGTSFGSSREWVYAYDDEDRLTDTTLPVSARKIKNEYDERGLQTKVTVAHGTGDAKSITYAHDDNGNLTSTKDGLNNESTIAYDGFDRSTKLTDPESHYRVMEYDSNGNVQTITSRNSATTKLASNVTEYDKDNLATKRRIWAKESDLTTSIGTGWLDTTLEYDKAGLLTEVDDPCGCGGGTGTEITYDAAGRRVTTKDDAGHLVRFLLDDASRLTKIERDEIDGSTTRTYVTEHEYDKDGHLTKSKDRGNGTSTALTTTIDVDALGRVTKVTDPNSNYVSYKRDEFGRVTKTLRDAGGIETRTEYDDNDNVLSRIIEKGATDGITEYIYDNADRVVTIKDEGGTIERVAYDDADNIITIWDRNGSRTDCDFDDRNLLTKKTYTKATNVVGPGQVKLWYDGLARITKAYNEDGLVTRTWNTLSKLEQEKSWIMPTNESGAGTNPRDVNYVYDSSGRVSETEYPDDEIWLEYQYDALNNVTKIRKKHGAGATYADLATWTFQGPSRIKQLDFPGNDTKEVLTYDVYGRATQMVHDRPKGASRQNLYDFKRGYDSGSRPTWERRDYWKNDGTQLTGTRDFGDLYKYDGADRLTKVLRGVGYHTTGHSAVETAADSTLNFVTRTEYTLDDSGNRQTLLYWDSDNSSSQQVRREDHEFDLENQLTTRKVLTGTPPANPTTTTGDYDANGTLTGGTILSSSVKVDMENRVYESGGWTYRYDPFGRRTEKKDSSCAYWRRFYYDGVRCIQEWLYCDYDSCEECVDYDHPIWTRVYGPYLVDQILWGEYDVDGLESSASDYFYFHLDFLGTVVAITDEPASGDPEIKEAYRYEEYGAATVVDGDGVVRSGGSTYQQDFMYTGRRWDVELDTYYYRQRTYNQNTGTFQSVDPAGSDRYLNLYTYVESWPIQWIDPMGRNPLAALLAGAGSALAAHQAWVAAGTFIAAAAFLTKVHQEIEGFPSPFPIGIPWTPGVPNPWTGGGGIPGRTPGPGGPGGGAGTPKPFDPWEVFNPLNPNNPLGPGGGGIPGPGPGPGGGGITGPYGPGGGGGISWPGGGIAPGPFPVPFPNPFPAPVPVPVSLPRPVPLPFEWPDDSAYDHPRGGESEKPRGWGDEEWCEEMADAMHAACKTLARVDKESASACHRQVQRWYSACMWDKPVPPMPNHPDWRSIPISPGKKEK